MVKKGEVSLVIPVTMIRTKALQTEEKGIDMELLLTGILQLITIMVPAIRPLG